MVASLLKMGLRSIDTLATTAVARRSGRDRGMEARRHPLAAYPSLRAMLTEAERSGMLAAERRRLMTRRLSA